MKKSNLIPKQKYIRRRTVDGKKTESIMECIQITPAGGVFFCGGNLEKLTNEEIEEELRNANCNLERIQHLKDITHIRIVTKC